MFESNVRTLLPIMCQKYTTRCARPPWKREPEDDVRATIDNRLEQHRIFLRIVFEVGALDDDGVARRGLEPVRSAALPLFDLG